MASKIVTLKDHNNDIAYPITPVDAVFVDSNTTLSDELAEKADTDLINVDAGAVTTAKIASNAVTSQKIDFTTFPHVIACGTKSYSALNAQTYEYANITIPTQPDTNYYVIVTERNNDSYWTKLYFTIMSNSKTTTGFQVQVYNDGTPGQNAGAGYFDYIVARND